MSMVNEKDSTSFRFSDGLRVLVIDADLTYLQTLAKMNQSCGYKVTTASRANDVLSILGEDKSKFDIVITDINTIDMNGFQLIEIITQKMNLPVVIISAISDNDSIVKGINSGACDYLIKPVQMENIKLIWKHVVRKQRYGNFNALEQSKMLEKVENYCKRLSVLNSDERKTIRAGSLNSDKKEEKEDKEKDDPASVKKPRMVWTSELHQQFVTVVDQIGVKNAVPKKILEMMNVDGLTRENVASHLQKYRLHIRKKDESMQQKVQMQSQAINFGLNSQMYSYNNLQNQVHPTQDQLQQLGQKRSNPIYSGYIPQFDQMNMDNYGAQENHFVKQENLSQEVPNLMEKDHLPPLDQFSSFRISDTGILGDVRSSLWRQRPYKLQKLNDNASSKVISDMIWHPTTTLSSAIIDVTKGLASEFCEQDLSPLNGGNLYYASDRITDYTSDSAIEPIVFVQHYDQDDNGSYSEQFVGSLEAGCPTDDNTT